MDTKTFTRQTNTTPSANIDNDHTLPINPRRKFRRRDTSESSDRDEIDIDDEDMSESSEHELDALDSEDDFDAETGLPAEERRKFLRRQRREHSLKSRVAGVSASLSKDERKQVDKNLLRELMFNTALIGLWYFFSLSISLYNKWMFSPEKLNFHFPLFTTSLHMAVQFLLSSLVLLLVPSLRPTSKPRNDPSITTTTKPLLTPMFYITRLVPCGATTSLDIGLGNASLQTITLTFYTMCKSSVLIFVLVFAFLFRLEKPSVKLILIILCMTFGVVMMVFGETAFQLTGFLLAISASFFSGFRWALTQILLLRHPATSNPFATMFFLTPIMFVTLFVIALFSETPSAVIVGLQILANDVGNFKAVLLMFVPGVLAFCMIASEFTLLQRTNVVTLSICGIFKEVVTISAAGIVFHDELSAINVSGLLVTIASIACYNYMKVSKMRQDARESLTKKEGVKPAPVVGERYVEEPASQPLMDGVEGEDGEAALPRKRSGSGSINAGKKL